MKKMMMLIGGVSIIGASVYLMNNKSAKKAMVKQMDNLEDKISKTINN